MKKKMLIEIGDDIDLEFLQQNCKNDGLTCKVIPEYKAIANGKVLSGMTNGDILMALFNVEILFVSKPFNVITVRYDNHSKTYDLSWWDAPYVESEE